MDRLLTHPHSPRFINSLSFFALLFSFVFVLSSCGTTALAAPARVTQVHSANNQHFTPQARIGFKSGDDWEPSITADRYGHVYALYKHYDVTGGQTCTGCGLHLLVQRSSDAGMTWSAPRPIAPIAVKGGQYDPQIVVDQQDGRTIWASFLQNSRSLIVALKSTNLGITWSAPMMVT